MVNQFKCWNLLNKPSQTTNSIVQHCDDVEGNQAKI